MGWAPPGSGEQAIIDWLDRNSDKAQELADVLVDMGHDEHATAHLEAWAAMEAVAAGIDIDQESIDGRIAAGGTVMYQVRQTYCS